MVIIARYDAILNQSECAHLDNHLSNYTNGIGIPRNKGVNFHGKFGLGIPKHNNSGSKNLEIPRNSQKFQVYSQQDLEFLGIPKNSNSENQ